MRSEMQILCAGAAVLIGPEDDQVEALVAAACLRGDAVTYECIWWEGKTRKVEWLAEHEVTPSTVKRTHVRTIGFTTEAAT